MTPSRQEPQKRETNMSALTSATPLYLNRHLFSDVSPFEVVRVISDKTVEIRAMNAVLDPAWKRDFTPGGFFGHTANNESQRYIYSQNLEAPIVRARITKSGIWSVSGEARYFASDKPRRFYDFNF